MRSFVGIVVLAWLRCSCRYKSFSLVENPTKGTQHYYIHESTAEKKKQNKMTNLFFFTLWPFIWIKFVIKTTIFYSEICSELVLLKVCLCLTKSDVSFLFSLNLKLLTLTGPRGTFWRFVFVCFILPPCWQIIVYYRMSNLADDLCGQSREREDTWQLPYILGTGSTWICKHMSNFHDKLWLISCLRGVENTNRVA